MTTLKNLKQTDRQKTRNFRPMVFCHFLDLSNEYTKCPESLRTLGIREMKNLAILHENDSRLGTRLLLSYWY